MRLESSENHATDPALSRRSFLELSGAAAGALAAGAALNSPGRAYPAENRKRVRLGVVGGGFGSTFHWHEHPNCTVAAVTDLYPQRREALKNRYKCDNVYPSLEEMLTKEKGLDAVAVFSGATDHARHVRACMQRGWHVVSAVPVCTRLEDAAMLKDVKEKTGMRYMMAESSWYRQECIFARNLFKAGGFGELFYSECEYYHDVRDEAVPGRLGYNPDGTKSWRWGFPPMFYPTHSLGFLTGVTGEWIAKVSCLGWKAAKPEVRNHPFQENLYNNPFFCQASMMLTDRGHMCRVNEFRYCVAHGERAQWFGSDATLYMETAGLHGNIHSVHGK